MSENRRMVRLAERVREELADILIKSIRDPRVAHVSITYVTLSNDLQNAKVYIRSVVSHQDVKSQTVLKGLQSAAKLLQSELGHRLNLRYTPKLAFFYDEGVEARSRIDAILDEIKRETPSS